MDLKGKELQTEAGILYPTFQIFSRSPHSSEALYPNPLSQSIGTLFLGYTPGGFGGRILGMDWTHLGAPEQTGFSCFPFEQSIYTRCPLKSLPKKRATCNGKMLRTEAGSSWQDLYWKVQRAYHFLVPGLHPGVLLTARATVISPPSSLGEHGDKSYLLSFLSLSPYVVPHLSVSWCWRWAASPPCRRKQGIKLGQRILKEKPFNFLLNKLRFCRKREHFDHALGKPNIL